MVSLQAHGIIQKRKNHFGAKMLRVLDGLIMVWFWAALPVQIFLVSMIVGWFVSGLSDKVIDVCTNGIPVTPDEPHDPNCKHCRGKGKK
jgi:hypothetical protein